MKDKKRSLRGFYIVILCALGWVEVGPFNPKFVLLIFALLGLEEILKSFGLIKVSKVDYGKYYWKFVLGICVGTILAVFLVELLKHFEITF